MVLMAITGELGSGKTLTLTYLAWRNHTKKSMDVYSNYSLFGIPYKKIDSLVKLEQMRNGFFAGDELWLWLSGLGSSVLEKVTADILLKSRKRGLTYAFTTQTIGQIPPRVRKVVDFTVYPIIAASDTLCKVLIFQGPKPDMHSHLKTLYFKTKPVYTMYNTREEIQPLKQTSSVPFEEVFEPPRDLEKEDKEDEDKYKVI